MRHERPSRDNRIAMGTHWPTLLNLYPEFAETRSGVHNHLVVIEALTEQDPISVKAAFENDIRDGYRKLRREAPDKQG